jgi:tRNA(fMet)-specific endonuclease VapC
VSYLLDTNVCIALINGISSQVRARFVQATRINAVLSTSTIVAHELWYGVAKSDRVAPNSRRLVTFLSRELSVLDFSTQDAQAAGEIRVYLERRGERIGEYDTLIAGQAYARNLVLVTAKTSEFARVKGLVVEDWTV